MKQLLFELFDKSNRKITLRFLIVAFILICTALIVGIDDNPPGIILIYIGFIVLTSSFVYLWRSAKKFFILFIYSLISLPVLGVLHNLFHGLVEIDGDVIVLSQILKFLNVLFFLIALIVCPPCILVGAVGSIYYYFKNKENR